MDILASGPKTKNSTDSLATAITQFSENGKMGNHRLNRDEAGDSGDLAEKGKVCDNIVANVVTDFAPQLALKARKNDTFAIAKGGVNFVDSGNPAKNDKRGRIDDKLREIVANSGAIVANVKATKDGDNGLSPTIPRVGFPTIYNRLSFRAIVYFAQHLALGVEEVLGPIYNYINPKSCINTIAKVNTNFVQELALSLGQNSLESQSQHSREIPYSIKASILGIHGKAVLPMSQISLGCT